MKKIRIIEKICIILGCLLLLVSVIVIIKGEQLKKEVNNLENYKIYLEEQKEK